MEEQRRAQLMNSSKLSVELKSFLDETGLQWTDEWRGLNVVVLLGESSDSAGENNLAYILANTVSRTEKEHDRFEVPGVGEVLELQLSLNELAALEACPQVVRVQLNRFYDLHHPEQKKEDSLKKRGEEIE